MASMKTLIKDPNEVMSAFNARLLKECSDAPVTDFHAVVTDGEPAITLLSEMIEVDEEMVAEAKENGETLKLEELVPENDPIIVQVMKLGAYGDYAAKAEHNAAALAKRAQGEIDDVEMIKGPAYAWVRDRNDFKDDGVTLVDPKAPARHIMVPAESVFMVMAYIDVEEPAAKPARK